MMSNKPEKKQTGKVNYIWVMAGGYLVYLAFKLFLGVFRGETDTPAVGIIGGIAFVLVGGGVLLREWKAYKYGLDHIDDPDSWSDGEEADPFEGLREGGEDGEAVEELPEYVEEDEE